MSSLHKYLVEEVSLTCSATTATIVRSGIRCTLTDEHNGRPLHRFLSGQLPYYYRSPEKIAEDFRSRRDALDMTADLVVKLPRTDKFQQSHCGEILCSLYLEHVLHLRRLYSKLTLTTAEDVNVHKMDAFFVDTKQTPYVYYAVEAKSSVMPTSSTKKFRGHRYGILRQLITSLDGYGTWDLRFDLTAIRDNLESTFTPDESKVIRNDLVPPGPEHLVHLGMAAVNNSTVTQDDDDYILTTPCSKEFNYRALVVADLASLAQQAFATMLSAERLGL